MVYSLNIVSDHNEGKFTYFMKCYWKGKNLTNHGWCDDAKKDLIFEGI